MTDDGILNRNVCLVSVKTFMLASYFHISCIIVYTCSVREGIDQNQVTYILLDAMFDSIIFKPGTTANILGQ
jgi:hypothetical protein